MLEQDINLLPGERYEDGVILGIDNHAPYSPSSCEKNINCFASPALSRGLQGKHTSDEAKEGALAHDVAGWFVTDKFEGRPYRDISDSKYDNAMKTHAVAWAEHCYEVCQPFMNYKHIWMVEERIIANPLNWGTGDFIFIFKPKKEKNEVFIIVRDYKYGENIIVKAESWQLVNYIKCIANSLSSLGTVIGADAGIFQPRAQQEPVNEIYQYDELVDKYKKIDEMISIVEAWLRLPELPLAEIERYQNPGDWCRFCKAKGICNAYRTTNTGNTLEIFKGVLNKKKSVGGITEKEIIKSLKDPEIVKGLLTPEELGTLAYYASPLKGFIEAAVEAAESILLNGGHIPFVKVINKPDSRELDTSDERKLVAELTKRGIQKPIVTITKVIGLTQIEKELGKGAVDDLLKPQGSHYKIVPIDNPAPAVNVESQTAKMFKRASEDKKED